MSTFLYEDLLNAGERHISTIVASIRFWLNLRRTLSHVIIVKKNQTVNNFQNDFAPPKSAQSPTNYTSKRGKLIQLFESGGAFVIPSMCCQASPVFSTRRFQDRSNFYIFTSKPTAENLKMPHRNLEKMTQIFHY